MNLRRCALVLAGLSAAVPAAAFAPGLGVGSSQFTIGVVGYVPVICRASVDAAMVNPTPGTVQLGMLQEFCNSPNGYKVHADYSASLANAKILVDGTEVALEASGTTVVSGSSQAAIQSHSVALELPDGVQDGSISFRIEPL